MPHFIIDCPQEILQPEQAKKIMTSVFDAAESSQIFNRKDTKVRINPYQHYLLADGQKHFIHIFANIMPGRTSDQKNALSKRIIESLNKLFPDIDILSINVRDFEKAGYINKNMI